MFGMGMMRMGVNNGGGGGGASSFQLYWGTDAIMWNTDEVSWI
jgi:hypothetical protein